MRAVRLHGVGDLRLDEVTDAQPGAGEAVVAVEAAGVCGSDLHFLDGSARTGSTPMTLGHEITGRIHVAASPEWPPGLPVVVSPGSHCGACGSCRRGRANLCREARVLGIDRDGGLADLVAVPVASLTRRPDGVDPQVAATAVDAGATAWHAVHRRARVEPGRSAAVIGVGGLGTYALQMARALGADPVVAVDSDPSALERATALGADAVVLAEPGRSVGKEVKRLTEGGVDVAIELVGKATTVDAAIKSLCPGGTAVVVGVGLEPLVTIPPVLWSNNEYTLTGSYGSLPGDVERVLDDLESQRLAPPPVHAVPLDAAVDAIVAQARDGTTGRLIVVP